FKVRGCRLSRSWFTRQTLFNYQIVRTDRITWAFKKVTRHSVNFVPTGKTYAVIIKTQDGESCEVQMPGKKADEFLVTLASRAPWAVVGYSKELDQLWEKNRPGFIQGIEERKQNIAKL